MKKLRIGHLDIAFLPSQSSMTWSILVDWRIYDEGERWRLSVARQAWVPFSEHYGYVAAPWRRRILGLDWAWYRRGLE